MREKIFMTENALITIDFETSFPGMFWISNWSKDESYPNGYRYKLLSSVSEIQQFAELVVVIEEPDGNKTEMSRMDLKLPILKSVGDDFVKELSEEYNLDFEFQDLTEATTPQIFESKITKLGWSDFEIDE